MNFLVQEFSPERALLSTENRMVCGDTMSRWKFRVSWVMRKPFSGLIRLMMLRAVRRACEGGSQLLTARDATLMAVEDECVKLRFGTSPLSTA